ncbi:MAG: PEGA domain-containing protein [Deltaproteobacteria bacterium]
MILARRLIFFLFLAAYLFLCPFLILYALGYIFDPVRMDLDRTGALRVVTVPPQADVYLEGRRFLRQTPATIAGLLPGRYTVTLRLPGHAPWQHAVRIAPGEAATFDHVLLLADPLPKKEVLADRVTRTFASQDGRALVVAVSHRLADHFVYEASKDQFVPLAAPDSVYADFAVSSVFMSRDARAFVVAGGSLWNRRWLYLDRRSPAARTVDISDLVSGVPDLLLWEADREAFVFAVTAGRVDRWDIAEDAGHRDYWPAVRGLGFFRDKAFVLTQGGALVRSSLDKKEEQVLFEASGFSESLLGEEPFFHIEAFPDDVFFFRGRQGRLLSNLAPHTLLEEGCLGLKAFLARRSFLYWTKRSIYCARPKEDASVSVFGEEWDIDTLYAQGRDIRQCAWVYDDSHVLFSDGTSLNLLENGPQAEHRVTPVAEVLAGTSFLYNERTGEVFYVDRQTRQLTALSLVEKERPPAAGEGS